MIGFCSLRECRATATRRNNPVATPAPQSAPAFRSITDRKPLARVGVLFQLVPEAKSVKNRVHLDVWVGADNLDAQMERLTSRGALMGRPLLHCPSSLWRRRNPRCPPPERSRSRPLSQPQSAAW